ncbi:MAG TPA: vitamin K epoxide reductase family protein [Ktedonobacteraceae bacterium]|nr:vitamin K epoxide reductase family protein [Ktedonobacteraceae bacterium]
MEQRRRSWSQIFLLVCSLVGVGIAIYLTAVHYNENVPLVCSGSGIVNCALVLSSPYSLVPGTSIPISIPGLLWCALMAGLAIVGLNAQPGWLRPAQFAWALLGIVTVLYLVYVEVVRLHAICAWCTALHVLILLVFLVTLLRLTSPAQIPAELEAESSNSDRAEAARPSRRS